MTLLNEQETAQVETVIAEVEAKCAGELVVVVLGNSDGYEHYRAWWAMGLTLAASWAAVVVWPLVPLSVVFGGQAVVWAALYYLLRWPPLLRRVVPQRVFEAAVGARTQQLFIQRGLTETRERTGVLIVLSEAEHQVRVLADRGIHELVGAEGWNQHVTQLLSAIRAGQTAAGLTSLLHSVGDVLVQHFPARHDDLDELPDKVVRL